MILRFLGYVFLSVAVAALAYDGMRVLADHGQMTFTSVLQHWTAFSPATLERVRMAVEGVNSYLWSPLAMTVLLLPAWFVATGVGVLLYLAGYQPPRPALPEGI